MAAKVSSHDVDAIAKPIVAARISQVWSTAAERQFAWVSGQALQPTTDRAA
jgi:hypothetical protein